MIGRTLLILTCGLVLTACGARTPQPPEDRPEHAVLEGVEAPPLNRPLAAQPVRTPQVPETLQDGPGVVRVTVNGATFKGQLDETGELSVTDTAISLATADQRAIRIQYRAPSELTALPVRSGPGALRLLDRSGPEGADRVMVVRQGGALRLGEVWQSNAEPIRFDLGGSLVLQQRGTDTPGSGAVEVPVDVLDGGRAVARVPIGEATQVQTRSGIYQVFVRASHLSASSQPAGQFGDGYVLNAWVVRLEG